MEYPDSGLAVLHPARNEFIQLRIDTEEIRFVKSSESSGFSINVREHFCMALAAWCWGPCWKEDFSFPHLICWSDNTSAVSWTNQLHSKNIFGQEISRLIDLAEAVFSIGLSTRHLPGSTNRMSDACPRAWSAPYSHLWSELLCLWHQVQVPEHWRIIYKEFAVQRFGRIVARTVPSVEAVVALVRGHRIQSLAPERLDRRVPAACALRSILLPVRQWLHILQRKIATDHPMQDQRSHVVSSLGVRLQYQPPPPHHTMAIRATHRLNLPLAQATNHIVNSSDPAHATRLQLSP